MQLVRPFSKEDLPLSRDELDFAATLKTSLTCDAVVVNAASGANHDTSVGQRCTRSPPDITTPRARLTMHVEPDAPGAEASDKVRPDKVHGVRRRAHRHGRESYLGLDLQPETGPDGADVPRRA